MVRAAGNGGVEVSKREVLTFSLPYIHSLYMERCIKARHFSEICRFLFGQLIEGPILRCGKIVNKMYGLINHRLFGFCELFDCRRKFGRMSRYG